MNIFEIIPIVLGVIIAGAHILSVFAEGTASKIAYYINIGLHILLVASLLLMGGELELTVLCFMASLLVYLGAFYVKGLICGRKAENDSCISDGVPEDLPLEDNESFKEKPAASDGEVAR